MKVLFVTSEVAPYSKTGGLGDVSSALPLALHRLGCDVRLLTPRYGVIEPERFKLKPHGQDFAISMKGRTLRAVLLEQNELSGPPIYFLNCPVLFDRPGIYVDPFSNRDYLDNDYRYIALARAAMELPRLLDWQPDIFHCNDWQTALVAMYLHDAREHGDFASSRSVMTIHNMAYQGQFSKDSVERLNGAERYFHPGGPLEFYGLVNFLKAGIEFADAVNTVSPTYAKEIQSSFDFGYGLETVLRSRGDLAGILNGIDVDLWNPETDRWIERTYSAVTIERKVENKKALCALVGLPFDAHLPVLGIVSRIVSQKGFDILIPALTEMLSIPAQFILLGSGDPNDEHVLREIARLYPDRAAVKLGYDEKLSHLIEAGADMFLMPSRFEPCGLNQMMSMRYGTLPVVRATGGLTDTVIDADADPGSGTGFVFEEYSANDLIAAVQRAITAFQNHKRWRQLQQNAMHKDFSWDRSARSYLEQYKKCLKQAPRSVA